MERLAAEIVEIENESATRMVELEAKIAHLTEQLEEVGVLKDEALLENASLLTEVKPPPQTYKGDGKSACALLIPI